MRVRLKTLEQLEVEFKPYASRWEYDDALQIDFNNFNWYITTKMVDMLGKVIEVKSLKNNEDYTHIGFIDRVSYGFHESWFIFEEFFKEEEFMI
jgi:hypothetical protein